MTRQPARRTGERAFSYVEVCLAVVILALCIVPATRALPGILEGQRNAETRLQLSLIAQEKLEFAALALQARFIPSSQTGNLAATGHPDWRYEVVVSVPMAGGGRYATIFSRAWADRDGDLACDAEEPQVRYDTILSYRKWEP